MSFEAARVHTPAPTAGYKRIEAQSVCGCDHHPTFRPGGRPGALHKIAAVDEKRGALRGCALGIDRTLQTGKSSHVAERRRFAWQVLGMRLELCMRVGTCRSVIAWPPHRPPRAVTCRRSKAEGSEN
jgi:hypothetical protein